MIDDINFTKYSKNKIFKNLYKSNEIFDEEIEDTNQIIFRIPKDLTKIDNLILCYDGQNLFDSSTSHFGTIFDLESLINSFEDQVKKNFLVISDNHHLIFGELDLYLFLPTSDLGYRVSGRRL